MKTAERITLTTIRHLVHQLSEYGLNPTEWQLTLGPSHDGEISLRHRRERSFELRGEIAVKKSRAYWSRLDLASI